MAAAQPIAVQATGTDGAAGRSKSVSSPAQIGICTAMTGKDAECGESSSTLANDGHWQQKSPSGLDGENERVKGVEPSTFTLAT
jgi:hypothetical protein